ncbi:MAG: dTMP kinase [Nitrospiraceae bacterium]|nr:dTMP kinase [Nitrospiraceae bacterium]
MARRRRRFPGIFITLEGIEGSGKSTQAKRLGAHLRALGYRIVETREPGGTPLAEKIRAVLLDRTAEPFAPETEAFLVFAARRQHVTQVIEPALSRGAIVLCDRFNDSTLAYQGSARGLDLASLERMNGLATDELEPDLTLLFDLPAKTGLARRRRAAETNRLDRETLRFHEKVRAGFRSLARREPRRISLIDADRPEEAIARDVTQAVMPLLARTPRRKVRHAVR